MSEENQNYEIDLDLLDEDAVEEVVEINTETNPLDEPNPVADGVHRCKALLTPNGITSKEWTDKQGVKRPFVTVKFSLQVLDEGPDFNKRIFPQPLTTIVFDGKSEMAYLLIQILGGTPEAKAHVASLTNYVKLAKAFVEALKQEPVVRVETKWFAEYKNGKDKKGRDKYSTALSGMKNFKKRPDETYDPELNNTKHGDLRARAKVTDYFPDEG